MPRYTGINHLALVTGNLDATIRFWRDLLGLRMVATIGDKKYRQYFFELGDRDLIAFFEWPSIEPIPEKDAGRPVKGKVAFDHVALGVETDDDLWGIKDRLNGADIWVSEVIDQGFIHSIYTFDPNGITVEIAHSVPDMDIRREPVLRDPAPSATSREGSEPREDVWPAVTNPTPREERRVYPGEGQLFRRKPDQA
jgi:catechol 2,3-dioxygenase-like lactoylglutathione lyase family enzyme